MEAFVDLNIAGGDRTWKVLVTTKETLNISIREEQLQEAMGFKHLNLWLSCRFFPQVNHISPGF